MYDPRPRHLLVDHHLPARQAPAVTRVWLPDDPRPDRSLDLFVWGILGASLLSALLLRDPLLLLLAGTLLVGLAVLVAAARWQATRPGRAIERAIRAVEDGEHPRRVLDGLRVVQLAGRPRLRLRIAVRCLEASGRSRRLEWALRRQAVIWLIEARNEISKEKGA